MSTVGGGKFACGACGKTYAWKPELAGKRAKCACGAQIVVPTAARASTAPPAPPDEPEDLYGVAEPKAAGGTVAPRTMAPPVAPSAAAISSAGATAGAAIGYRSAETVHDREADRFSMDRMTHPPRDLYVPVALLVAGFVAMLAWAAADAGAVGMILVSILTGATTLIKLVVLIPMAMIVAPMLGISFGDFRTAILKFAAVIVFTDAAILWMWEIMESLGGAPASRRMEWRMIWVTLLGSAAFISLLSFYLFDMDGDETGYFALPMAIVSWLMSVVMMAVVSGVLEGLAAAASAAAAPPAPPPAAPPANVATGPAPAAAATPAPPAPPPGPVLIKNESDRQIVARIEQKTPLVREAGEYIERSVMGDQWLRFVRRFINVGATKVYFDLQGGKLARPVLAYVQLPDDPEGRARCFAVQAAYAKEEGLSVDPAAAADVGQRYMIVRMKQ